MKPIYQETILTTAVLVLLLLSNPNSSMDWKTMNETNYILAKNLCINGSTEDIGEPKVSYFARNSSGITTDIVLTDFAKNITKYWDETTDTCWCERYYVDVTSECNLSYWFIPRDLGIYMIGYEEPIDVKWCNQRINCTRLKYRLKHT